ncbi:MAG: Eco57I restriction-modification methylase domain-containing protein [Quinella sp. 1Q7]|nr:Eco57I restriction-modification methylase domain-containing protein [Quinella sp. 1Q7]
MPRAAKSDAEKFSRTRATAEVFTPSTVVKFMVDALDDGRLDSRWLEVACGEAPFITNRYDAVTGEAVTFDKRVGILDRKLRAIHGDKIPQALRAVQSVYGYELQGDSLLIARANVLLTFAEFAKPSAAMLNEAAQIVAQNFWQMDAYARYDDLFNPSPAIKICNHFAKGADPMKFDFVISNPPYQDDTSGGNKSYAPPVYNHFMKECRKIADKVVLITPARFLFNAGGTPKKFNGEMLNDKHLKILHYEPDSKKIFRNRNVDIEGGVVVTMYDNSRTFEPIGTFTPFAELNDIHQKVVVDNPDFRPLKEIIYSQTVYRLTKKFHADNPDAVNAISKGHANDFSTVLMNRFGNLFFDAAPEDGHDYVQVHGRQNNRRVCKWFRSDWVTHPAPFDKFKVLVSTANGRSNLGNDAAQLISEPVISEPFVVNTETYITIGAFDTRAEAEACLKYVKSKFARVMLGMLKVTQHATPDKWSKVPLQDFSSNVDIDWREDISDIDAQLYRKYGLSASEVEFIERHVKELT